MPRYITYEWDDFDSGYRRRNVPVNPAYIQPVGSGRMFAHDYVEHPRGYPTGTLEDEIAAFGTIIILRLRAGLIGGFYKAPDLAIADELKEMINMYREDCLPANVLKPRKRYWKSNEIELEDIADLISDNKILNQRLVAWFQYGVTRCRQRFPFDAYALNLFQNIERTVDDFLYNNPHYPDFTLGIDRDRAFITNIREY